MPPTYFKFTTPEGLNRRLTFSEKPPWPLLASKLHVLYGISPDNVGVSYLDNDNDVITVSSDEELQDFYKVSHQAGQVIKFAVVDLHFSQTNAGKPFEFSSLSRNPFDADAFEFEWERLPPDVLMEEDRPRSGPHGFVEVLSSSHSVAHDEMDTEEEDDHSAVRPPLLNKGKGRALSFGSASIASVLGEEISHKHPIHVYDLNSRKDDKAKDNNFDDPSVHIHVAAQSTPKVQAKNIDDNIGTKETPASAKAVEVEDPPLPSLDETPASATSASLFHDLTSLVHDVTQAVSSHPELSEGLRNIGRNISNGTYWTNHREALSETVKGMSNSPLTEERRQAEEEAGARRLADVVSNLFRSLSQVPVDTEDTPAPNINENHSDQFRGENVAPVTPPWLGFQGVRYGPMGLRSSYHHGRFPPFPHAPGYRPHMAPVYHPHAPHGSPHNGRPKPPRQSPFPFPHAPPVPPPPPPHTPLGAPPSHHPSPPHDHFSPVLSPPGTAQSSLGQQDIHILPPPVPSPNRIPAPMPDVQPSSEEMQSRGPSVNDRRQSYPGPSVSFFSLAGDQPRSQSSKPNAQDQRAQVEAAKRIYKAEKERYRQERDQRRREKLGRKPTVGHSATDGSGAVAQAEEHEMSSIQFQNMYPGVERVDVPRRSNTHLGHGPFQHLDKEPEDLTIRAMIRIAKKLSDMGFSENAYPTLPEKIKAQMPPNGAISKEVEDDVVTTLLEELLATASTGASGSG